MLLLIQFGKFDSFSGPKAAEVLQHGVKIDLNSLKFMNGASSDIFSAPNCRITRCGYTGEDGFEVCMISRCQSM